MGNVVEYVSKQKMYLCLLMVSVGENKEIFIQVVIIS